MHRGCPHTVNSPEYSDWKIYICCRWIMFYIKAQSVKGEPGLPPTYVSCDINICDSPFSCSHKKPSDISYKAYLETYLSSEKNAIPCLLPIFFLIKLYLKITHSAQSFSHTPKYCTGMWIQYIFILCAFLSISFLYLQKQFSVRKDRDR